MGIDELVRRQEQLQALLRNVGPAAFVRALRGATRPGELRAYATHDLDDGWRAACFLYADPRGERALVSIFIRSDPGGPALLLKLEPLARAA